MKITLKTLALRIVLPMLLVSAAYFGWSKVKASVKNAEPVKPVTIQVEYAFSSNGLMIGSVPSPLEIAQVTSNNTALPIGDTFKSDTDFLSTAVLRLRNTSNETIKSARLTIDWIDPQASRIFASICSMEVFRLASGVELTGKVTEITSERMQEGFVRSGRTNLRLLIRVDTVELANGTMWQYGVMHRRDPNRSDSWIQISHNSPSVMPLDSARAHNARFKPGSIGSSSAKAFTWCAYWKNLVHPQHYCESCGCNIYDDEYSYDPQPNGFAPFLFDIIPQGCGGNGWWECPGCYKQSIVAATC